MTDDVLLRVALRVAAVPGEMDEKSESEDGGVPVNKDWVAIQHDGKGEIVTVTPGIRAPNYGEAMGVLKDLMRRSGTRGKVVLLLKEDLDTHGISLKA